MAQVNPEIVPDPPQAEWLRWTDRIERKDAPILAAAILADVDRLVTLNTRDFPPAVAETAGLCIQTPSQLIQDLGRLV